MEELERKKLQKDTRPPPSQPGMNHLEKAGKVLVLLGVSGRMSACLPAEDVLAAPVDQRSRLLCLAEGGSKWRATIALLRALLASAKALDAYRIHPITEDTGSRFMLSAPLLGTEWRPPSALADDYVALLRLRPSGGSNHAASIEAVASAPQSRA